MATTATHVPQASSNSIARIGGVLFSPNETFDSIAQRPTWLAPVLLAVIVSIALIAVYSHRAGWQLVVQHDMASNPIAVRQMDQMSPEQKAQSMRLQLMIAPYTHYGSVVIGSFVFTIFIAAIFLGAFNLLFGAALPFKTSLGVAAYAFVPRTIYALLGTLVSTIKDPSQIDLQNLIASNPGALMSNESAPWLVALASQIDFFSFWIIILLAIGYHVANPKKISFGGAFCTVIASWLFYVIVRVALAAAFS
jgi:hypothetical protein